MYVPELGLVRVNGAQCQHAASKAGQVVVFVHLFAVVVLGDVEHILFRQFLSHYVVDSLRRLVVHVTIKWLGLAEQQPQLQQVLIVTVTHCTKRHV